jgi:hypothetical protein
MNQASPNRRKNHQKHTVKQTIDSKKLKNFSPHKQTLQTMSVFYSFFAEGVS